MHFQSIKLTEYNNLIDEQIIWSCRKFVRSADFLASVLKIFKCGGQNLWCKLSTLQQNACRHIGLKDV